MRWFLFCFLTPLALAVDYDKWKAHLEVMPLEMPDINNHEYFGEEVDWSDYTGPSLVGNMLHPTKETIWKFPNETSVLVLHFPLVGERFREDELDKLRKAYPKITGGDKAWDQFNDRTYAIKNLGITGSAWDIVRLYAMRRVVLNHFLVDDALEQKIVKNGIDFFDEYSSYRDCIDMSLNVADHQRHFAYIPPSRHISDRIEFINGSIHYIRYNSVCLTPGLNYCATLDEALDDNQGRPVEALADIQLRMVHHEYIDARGPKPTSMVTVKKWRLFDFCVREEKMDDDDVYPTIDRRLMELGFTKELLDQVDDRYQRLALRRFAQPLLTQWRAFEFTGYVDGEIEVLQHRERQLWLKKFKDDSKEDTLFY